MKKKLALLGAAMFFVVCVSLYLMMESASQTGSMTFTENDMDGIEAKIKEIEKNLQRNHKTINQIKDVVRDIADGDKTGIKRLQNLLNMPAATSHNSVQVPKPHFNQTKVNIPSDVCALSEAPAAKTDVQMLDVFDMLPFDNPDGGAWKQGWDIKYSVSSFEQQKLKVFVIPHSHCDPGWLKTFERYYSDQTRHILDNMLDKLVAYPKMRFIYAEMSFFSMWWSEISTKKRGLVKKLISERRLEIVTGGWVMTDEANAHYFAMLDQLIEGNQWLEDNVGFTPKSGWAIDPFGQSPTMAYILQGASFHNMLLQRVHYSVKKYLAKTKQLEFLWRQNWDNDGRTDMFTHMMPFYSYDVPHTCGPDPKVCCQFDFKRLPGGKVTCPWKIPPQEITRNNVAQKAETLLDQYRKKAQLYQNNVVLIPLGDDFRYDKPAEWDQQYNNYQMLFDYMNSKSEWHVEAQFGTLSDYFDALHVRAKKTSNERLPGGYPVLSGDFFTYSDRDDHYWSGYYTSRPFYKRLDRVMESYLRAGEIIYSIASAQSRQHSAWNFPEAGLMKALVTSRRSLALYQHHDGITGTAKDHVVVDYGSKLLQSINNMRRVMTDSAQYLLTYHHGDYTHDDNMFFDLDEQRGNHDEIPTKVVISLSKIPKQIAFYNSLAHHRTAIVVLHVSDSDVAVKNSDKETIQTQVDPYWINQYDISTAVFKVRFMVSVSGLGLNTYTIQKVDPGANPLNYVADVAFYNGDKKGSTGPFTIDDGTETEIELCNNNIKATVSSETGTVQSVTLVEAKKTVQTKVEFLMYGTVNKKDKSGAYLFLPDGPARPMVNPRPFIRVVKGPVSHEIHSFFQHVEHTVSVLNAPSVEGQGVQILNIVDIRGLSNKEIVMRVTSSVKNPDKTWYSDLNGFQMQRRQTLSKLPIQGNFYPMPTMAYIQDDSVRLSMLSGQSLGVASLETGWIEIVQDRRLNQDDNRGLSQGVLDNKRTPNIFTLLVECRDAKSTPKQNMGYPSLVAHHALLELIHPVFIMPKHNDFKRELAPNVQPLGQPLPCDVHLLNLRTLKKQGDDNDVPEHQTAVLFHRLGVDCSLPSAGMTCPTNFGKVNLGKLLAGNAITWKDIRSTSFNLVHDAADDLKIDEDITLSPMEIKVFKGHLH